MFASPVVLDQALYLKLWIFRSVECSLKPRVQGNQNLMRRRGCCRFLGSISWHAGDADHVWSMCPVDRINCVIDCGVQDRKAPRRMYRGWLRSGSPDDYEACSIPLNNHVDWLRRGVLWTLPFGAHGGAV